MHDDADVPMHDQPPLIPAEFQPRMQLVLDTLADIDFAHECELDNVNSAAIDASFKAKVIAKLDRCINRDATPTHQNSFSFTNGSDHG